MSADISASEARGGMITMGLRIIDRQFRRKTLITDTERLEALEQETQRWSDVKGTGNSDTQQEFISKFKRVKARIDSPAAMLAKAEQIRDDILGGRAGAETSHTKVDIATLLELLQNRGDD